MVSDDEIKPPPAAPHEIEAAVDEVCETSDDAGLAERIHAADVAASVEAGQFRDHGVVRVLAFLSEISDQPPAFTLAAVASIGGLATGRPRLAEAGLRSLAALALATAAKATVKALVTRTRPFMLLDHGEYETSLRQKNEGPWNSFPSGHTANAFAAARAISRVVPEASAALAATAAGIGAIQVPRGSHHPLDVVAGAAVGWAAEAVVDRAFTAAGCGQRNRLRR